jgi:gluconolactonase
MRRGHKSTGSKNLSEIIPNCPPFLCQNDGNIWAGMGWVGAGYDGVHIFAPDGTRISQMHLPEICANLCFGGTKRNRLFMAASQSLYTVYVETRDAHIT